MDPIGRACAGLLLGLMIAPELPGPAWAWACLALGLALLALPGHGLGGWRGVLAAVAIGVLCGRTVPEGPELHGPIALQGVRVGASTGRAGDVRIVRWRRPGGDWVPLDGRVRVRFPQLVPPPGTPVAVVGGAGGIPRALPGAPDPVRAARLSGVRTEVRARAVARLDGEHASTIGADRDPTGLLRALVLGDTSGCSPESLAILRGTGTSHLLSVSGFHVGIAAGTVTALATALLRAIALWRPAGVSTRPALAVGVVSAWAYTAMVGSPVATQRAAAMLTLVAAGRAADRRAEAVPLLALVAAGLAVIDPGVAATPSYQLTFGAMFGLVTIVPRLVRYVPPDLPLLLRWTANGLAATVGSTLGTLPFAAWWFQQLAPLAPVANLVAMPLLGVLAMPFAAAACFAPDPVGALAAVAGTALCRATLWLLAWLAVAPLAPAVGPLGALGLAMAVAVGLRRPLVGLGLGFAVLLPWAPAPRHLTFTFLDVGQGSATLVEDADGARVLVDGGASAGAVLAYLRRRGIRRLDAVVQSHPDRDHAGGLPAIVRALDVDVILAADPSPELLAAAAEARVPIRAPVGALNPWPADPGDDNDRSVALQLGPVLLPGDIERAGEARVARRLAGPVAVLALAHHGSATSSTPALLDAARPLLAVASAGAGNPFGHPHPAVLRRLRVRGIPVVRTDLDGTVVVEVRGDTLAVRTRWGRAELSCRGRCG